MISPKQRPRIEQMAFGVELMQYLDRLINTVDTIVNLENMSETVEELNDLLSDMSNQIADKLGTLDMVPSLYVLEKTFDFRIEEELFIKIPSKAIELKTITFKNMTNNDALEMTISERNDFSTIDYSSLTRESVYDIASIPIIDQDNDEDYKLKIRFRNKSSDINTVVVYLKIKLTNFSIKQLEE